MRCLFEKNKEKQKMRAQKDDKIERKENKKKKKNEDFLRRAHNTGQHNPLNPCMRFW